ncbi:MAG: antibiotic biosynthesis monooxygenase [Burkholderiales bacterium]|nr:antibiotic biosynthesis monooxygenase [Anaerolineae bacterium]
MIARAWRAVADVDKAPQYEAHFQHDVLPELREIDGYKGAYLLKREENGAVIIAVLTLWESMNAVQAFAGDQPDMAVVSPAAQAVLRSFDTGVMNYEVAFTDQIE